jgi:hypothetical protein
MGFFHDIAKIRNYIDQKSLRGLLSVICGHILSMGDHYPTEFVLDNDLPLITYAHKSH